MAKHVNSLQRRGRYFNIQDCYDEKRTEEPHAASHLNLTGKVVTHFRSECSDIFLQEY